MMNKVKNHITLQIRLATFQLQEIDPHLKDLQSALPHLGKLAPIFASFDKQTFSQGLKKEVENFQQRWNQFFLATLEEEFWEDLYRFVDLSFRDIIHQTQNKRTIESAIGRFKPAMKNLFKRHFPKDHDESNWKTFVDSYAVKKDFIADWQIFVKEYWPYQSQLNPADYFNPYFSELEKILPKGLSLDGRLHFGGLMTYDFSFDALKGFFESLKNDFVQCPMTSVEAMKAFCQSTQVLQQDFSLLQWVSIPTSRINAFLCRRAIDPEVTFIHFCTSYSAEEPECKERPIRQRPPNPQVRPNSSIRRIQTDPEIGRNSLDLSSPWELLKFLKENIFVLGIILFAMIYEGIRWLSAPYGKSSQAKKVAQVKKKQKKKGQIEPVTKWKKRNQSLSMKECYSKG